MVPYEEKPSLSVQAFNSTLPLNWHSTRIPNIEIYRECCPEELRLLELKKYLSAFFHAPAIGSCLKDHYQKSFKKINKTKTSKTKIIFWGEAANSKGKKVWMKIDYNYKRKNHLETLVAAVKTILLAPRPANIYTPSMLFSLEQLKKINKIHISHSLEEENL